MADLDKCYGPLYSRLANIVDIPGRRETDLVTRFLRAGIIVPAIRQGDTMLDAWTHSRYGVHPGTNAAVERGDGNKILAFVDEETSTYANLCKLAPRDG